MNRTKLTTVVGVVLVLIMNSLKFHYLSYGHRARLTFDVLKDANLRIFQGLIAS